jgi:maltooligosyltrehalose synthase
MAWVMAVAPRFPLVPAKQIGLAPAKQAWRGTDLEFPATAPRRWSNLFTGEVVEVPHAGHAPLSALLGRFPVALLVALPD